jgi:predicted small secreted protein
MADDSASPNFRTPELVMKRNLLLSLLLISVAAILTACGGGAGSGQQLSSPAVFITGEDAPLPSVLGFDVTLNSITLNNNGGSVPVLSQPTTVDFARLVGLRSLLGFNTVAEGTYTSATFTLANPVISYLNIGTNPPTMSTMNGTLTTSTVTVAFPTPLVVGSSGLAGLHMDFDLRQSLAVDNTRQITGSVDPHIYIAAVRASDDEGLVTDFTGGLVSVNASANTFVVQGPYGFNLTVDVNALTQFNGSWSLGSLAVPAVVSVEGVMQADGSLRANEVEVITTQPAFVSGRILAVNPTSGPVQTVTMYVAEELPALGSIPVDSVQTFNVSAVSEYDVCFFDNWFTNYLFNSSELVVGQRIFIGGSYDSSSGTFTPAMISLRRQGVVGDLVVNSVSITAGNQGTFQLQNNLLLGYVLGAPLTVNTGNSTNFVNIGGLSGLQAAGSTNLVVRGLVFKDSSGNPEVWAHRVRVLP